jgi:hypothetical protein
MGALAQYNKELLEVAAEKGFWLRILGSIGGYKIWLIRTRDYYVPDYTRKELRLLIAAGFHGEEPAGPWAILEWLKRCDTHLLTQIDLSFIPMVNPYGFKGSTSRKTVRYGPSGMKTNTGFCHTVETGEEPSPEGQILLDHINLIRPLAQNGFLSLHEDKTERSFYLYTFEHGDEPGSFTEGLKKELKSHFPKYLDEVKVLTDADQGNSPVAKKGVIFRLCDGSFEDWMFHLGVERCATTETPGRYRLKRRIDAGVAVIDKFISLCQEEI